MCCGTNVIHEAIIFDDYHQISIKEKRYLWVLNVDSPITAAFVFDLQVLIRTIWCYQSLCDHLYCYFIYMVITNIN